MFLVVWISDRNEELAVSPGAADILWRAASGCIDEAGIDNAGPVMRSMRTECSQPSPKS
jgi:hypothetical protein